MADTPPADSGAPNGQTPGPGAPAGNTTGDAGGQAGSPGAGADTPIANPEAKRYADEAAAARAAVKQLEAQLKKFQDAQKAADLAKLDDLGKAQRELADLQEQHNQYQVTAQQRIVRAEVKTLAAQMGLNPELAARLVDFAEIEYDADGEPKNLAKLLTAAVQTYGLTPTPATPGAPNGTNGTAPRPPVSSGAPVNPGRGATPGGWSWDVIGKMTPDAYARLSDAQKAEMTAYIYAHPRPSR